MAATAAVTVAVLYYVVGHLQNAPGLTANAVDIKIYGVIFYFANHHFAAENP